MDLIKLPMKGEEWCIEIKGKLIGVSAIKSLCIPILIIVIAAFAYNYGAWATYEQMHWIAVYHGMCDTTTHQCWKCLATSDNGKLAWLCPNVTFKDIMGTAKSVDWNFTTVNLTNR